MKDAFLFIFGIHHLKWIPKFILKINKFKEKFDPPLPSNEEKVLGESFFILFFY